METALMRAKPRCGHGMAFAKKVRRLSRSSFKIAGSSNLSNHQQPPAVADQFGDFCLPVLNGVGRGMAIVSANIARGSVARIRARQKQSDP
jgi:hypothetical protein